MIAARGNEAPAPPDSDASAAFTPLAEPISVAPPDLRSAAAGSLALRVSPKYLEEHCILPLGIDAAHRIVFASGEALDPSVVDELTWTFGHQVRLVDAPVAEIQTAVLGAQRDASTSTRAADAQGGDLELVASEDDALDDLRALANQAPVIKMVNVMILEALRARASDIHLESTPDGLRIRYRVDGMLREMQRPPRQYQAAVISRIKIMASLNIAERRLAQDGRIRLRLSDRELDLRVSITPSLHGESVVLRVLDRGAGVRELTEIGIPDDLLPAIEALIQRPHGIFLVTGPTGSGKTTTLYGGLRRINKAGVKVVTVEDPVEYQIEGITQIQVNTKTGMTFASALRSILRHDPDIIMVGEMRDTETAEIAIQAALTGHLVFSTLHTNDAPGGITRLVDMGVEPYLVSATVQAILAQRLVRLVCTACSEPYQPASDELARAGAPAIPAGDTPRFRRGRGCDLCLGTGYRGRTGVYELMLLSPEIRERISARAPLDEIRELARRQGMVPLRAAAWAKVSEGLTTVEEVLRVSQEEAGA
ncbi:MAG: GspE/PulE family protein [Gemmatimonadota bacterium]|nr:GspE/PulE family protein [Gemmatimonadota bacterium]